MKTQVDIVGAGPAVLLLGHALRQAEITCIVVERTSQARVEARIRAGILEATLTDLLARLGVDTRLKVEGLLHDGLTLVSDGDVIPIDITGPTGKHGTAYGQTEITRDLIAAAPAAGLDIVWDAGEVALHDVDTDHPSLGFTVDGAARSIDCDVIAGCDGFHGPSRAAVGGASFERAYPHQHTHHRQGGPYSTPIGGPVCTLINRLSRLEVRRDLADQAYRDRIGDVGQKLGNRQRTFPWADRHPDDGGDHRPTRARHEHGPREIPQNRRGQKTSSAACPILEKSRAWPPISLPRKRVGSRVRRSTSAADGSSSDPSGECTSARGSYDDCRYWLLRPNR